MAEWMFWITFSEKQKPGPVGQSWLLMTFDLGRYITEAYTHF